MSSKISVRLSKLARIQLKKLVSSGKAPARKLMRARILLLADEAIEHAGQKDEDIIKALDVCRTTIQNVRRCYASEGLEAALSRKPQPARPDKRRLDGDGEARLIAVACGEPPDGHRVWTMQLLADELVELGVIDHISGDTVSRVLKKRT